MNLNNPHLINHIAYWRCTDPSAVFKNIDLTNGINVNKMGMTGYNSNLTEDVQQDFNNTLQYHSSSAYINARQGTATMIFEKTFEPELFYLCKNNSLIHTWSITSQVRQFDAGAGNAIVGTITEIVTGYVSSVKSDSSYDSTPGMTFNMLIQASKVVRKYIDGTETPLFRFSPGSVEVNGINVVTV